MNTVYLLIVKDYNADDEHSNPSLSVDVVEVYKVYEDAIFAANIAHETESTPWREYEVWKRNLK